MKTVAVIMTNYKNYAEQFLDDAVSSLFQQTYSQDNFKLFIVDNSSSEKSRKYIKKIAPLAEIVVNEGEKINKGNNGYAKGNNQGFKIAIEQGFDYLVVVNMDVVFDKDWLTNLVKMANNQSEAGAIQSKILLHKDKTIINSVGNKIHFLGFGYCESYGMRDKGFSSYKEIDYASGCSVLYKTDVLIEVGLYDENYFMYHEDADLSWRIWLAGYKVILASKSIVYHKYEFGRSMNQFYYMERNRFLTILTNYKLATLFVILPAFYIMELGLLVFSIKNKTWKTKLKVYLYFLNPFHWLKLYKDRVIKQSRRKMKDKDIVRRFTGSLDFQEVNNPVLKYIANPFFCLYWAIIKRLIIW